MSRRTEAQDSRAARSKIASLLNLSGDKIALVRMCDSPRHGWMTACLIVFGLGQVSQAGLRTGGRAHSLTVGYEVLEVDKGSMMTGRIGKEKERYCSEMMIA